MSKEEAWVAGGKIAIVTGGSRGLGRNTVLHLAKRGVRSIFTYNANRAEADKVVAAVSEAGSQAIALQLDTGKVSAFERFVKDVRKALGELGAERFDYLVNNAGNSHHTAFDKTTEEELDSLYSVHFKGVFFLTQKLLPLIHDGGRIVNISSGLTRFTFPGRASCIHEGGNRGAHPLPGKGARPTGDRGQHRRSGCHRYRFQRRHGAG